MSIILDESGIPIDAGNAAGLVIRLRTENEKLKAELAEAKKDAERFRWLIKNFVHKKNLGDKYIEFHCDFENWNNVIAAIDAAMKGK